MPPPAEAQETGQQEAASETTEDTRQSSRETDTSRDDSGEASRDITVPKYRLDQESKARKDAERELKRLRDEQSKAEEDRASKQGEWQQVAEKRQKKIDTLQGEVTNLKNQITRDRRYRMWVQASNGVVRSDALSDAFEHITEDEWQTANEEDENSVRALAQGLVERKGYLADGMVGAGSGGSSRPLIGTKTSQGNSQGTTQLSTGRTVFHLNKKQKHW